GDSFAEQFETAAEASPQQNANGAGVESTRRDTLPRVPDMEKHAPRKRSIEPALSPTIVRRLGRVVPANLQIDARWDAIRTARQGTKKKEGKHAPPPSVMVAWAVVRAMEKHAPFRRLSQD